MFANFSSLVLLLTANIGLSVALPKLCGIEGPDNCKCFPGDDCWPEQSQWAALNATVDGRLVATVPLGSPCHDPSYDANQCAELQDEWRFSSIQ